jgi:8-oxo-dGTP pyrophosphatase MutT (NUDIX family)
MNYVLTLVTRNLEALENTTDFELILVEKDKPAWQRMRYNLPGGKIEENELPEQAAIRECFEETGIAAANCIEKGIICGGNCPTQGSDFTIYCYQMTGIAQYKLGPHESETQKVFWAKWSEVKDDERLMPNLRVAIPMMVANSNKWIITDNSPSWTSDRHSFVIEVPSTTKKFG